MKTKTKKPTKKSVVVKKEVAKVETPKKTIVLKKLSKKTTITLIVAVVLIALIGGAFYKFGTVATVNGTPIYRWTYLKALQESDSTVLDQLVQNALIEGEAKAKGVVVAQKDIDESLATIEAQVKEQGMTLEEALESESLTKEDLISQIKTQKIAESLASPSAEPTQAEIEAFLKENKDYLPTGKTTAELQALAKTQLETTAKNTALTTWYNNLKAAAKIIYK